MSRPGEGDGGARAGAERDGARDLVGGDGLVEPEEIAATAGMDKGGARGFRGTTATARDGPGPA